MRDSRAIAGLEFHVDYFDDAQWRDPFANHTYTVRQKELAKATTRDVYVTPQIWLDGQPWQKWPKGPPPEPVPSGSSALAMTVVPGATLHARFELRDTGGTDTAEYRLFAAVTENGLSRSVAGGENKGKRLFHDNVVRGFAGPFPAAQVDVEFQLPEGVNLANSTVVGFLQGVHGAKVIDVVRVPLSKCPSQ